MNIRLTPEQEEAKNRILAFVRKPGKGVFILKGYAGTGKTFLLQMVGKELAQEKRVFSLLASTGRAASILRAKTEFTANTVHAALYKFSHIEGDHEELPDDAAVDQFGQMKLSFSLRIPDEKSHLLYIVDEASMISNVPSGDGDYANFGTGYILNDFFSVIGHNKVIFCGDPAQLPPVSQIESPALNENWFRQYGLPVETYSLTTILRQSGGNDIIQLATQVRNMIGQTFRNRWIKIPASNLRGVHCLPLETMKREHLQFLIKNGFGSSIAVTNSNKNCHVINGFIREKRFGLANSKLQIGDILMVNQNNHLVPIVNGDMVEVLTIGPIMTRAGLHFQQCSVKALHNEKEYDTLISLDVLYGNGPNLNSEQQRLLLIDYSRRMRSRDIRPKSPAYYNDLLKDPYLNSLRASFGYAVTCHKAQGGEWDTVFLYLNKSMYSMEQESLIRWWYTAITRAKSRLVMVDDYWIN
ncbi:ATP-dependent DNA helicase [Flavihumibacter profundi]|uniref:ATP-dependent DNA helicase n=1 Tax=Flavihumibacter profundi TaxID=2716883 RepID=UPI001CC7237C|nr:DEAD/DEAH box helicase [Flavihumibacter profundi]MBZ5857571.1 AAA family ATPase [Flavihumibacter profundi]